MAIRKTKGFLKTPAQLKKAGSAPMVSAGITAVSTVAAKIGSGALSKMIPANFQKAINPAMMVLGVVGEAYLADEKLQAVARGVAASGALQTFGEFAPTSIKAAVGFSGIADENIDWAELARQAEAQTAAETVSGVDMSDDDDDYYDEVEY